MTRPDRRESAAGAGRTVVVMSSELVDWDLAASTARRLVRPGPSVSYAEAARAVDELRTLAVESERHVRDFTGLTAAPDAPPVAVVDRPGWVAANIEGFRIVLEPLFVKLAARRRPGGGVTAAVGARVTGVQVGTILAYLASRVLGQYEVFLPPEHGAGRLTLVAPNILATEALLGVDPHDFRLWVCLHEETHRTQFTGVPWLRGHVQSEIGAYLDATDLDPAAVWRRLREASGAIGAAVRGGADGGSVLEAVQTPQQRVVLDRLTALMSLLEGHGDFVMDAVGPEVVPSVAEIRRRFDRRRHGGRPLDRVVRRLLGIDLKMKQYAEGARFVRTVVDAVGVRRFNAVWTSAETLPTLVEVRHPQAWMDRVLGRSAVPA